MAILLTQRLILRPWRESDFAPFAQMNADPRVMEFFLSTRSMDESYGLAKKIMDDFRETVDGFDDTGARKNNAWHWVVALKEDPEQKFIGMVGLKRVTLDMPFASSVEIFWRLMYDVWGRGYATVNNMRSRRVMEKLGMTRDATGDFDNPRFPAGHALSRHVLYRCQRS